MADNCKTSGAQKAFAKDMYELLDRHLAGDLCMQCAAVGMMEYVGFVLTQWLDAAPGDLDHVKDLIKGEIIAPALEGLTAESADDMILAFVDCDEDEEPPAEPPPPAVTH